MTNDEELAALKARVAELEALVPKPPKPFTEEPYQRWDPTAGMSMPRSTLLEMAAAVPDSAIKGIVAEQRTSSVNQGPSAAGVGGTISSVHPNPGMPGSHRGTGWVEAKPLGPPPGVAAADRLMDAQDAKDRHELVMEEARRLATQKLADR
jgi:hypothetical protein